MRLCLLFVPSVAIASMLFSPDPVRAQEEICDEELGRLESIADVVEIEPEREEQVEQLSATVRQACANGDIESATASLSEAWTLLLEDTELTVPAPEEITSQPCTRGIQNVQGRLGEAQASDFVQDAVGTLIVDAEQLCEEDRPADAQNKLAMAWSMLEQRN